MVNAQLLSALMAAGVAFAADTTCTKDMEISEPTPSFDKDCDVFDAKLTIGSEVSGELVLEGPKRIKGDLILKNSSITSVSSSSINSIEGKFTLDSLLFLKSVNMPSLETANEIEFTNLNQLDTLTFNSKGISEVKSIKISDTFLEDLSGFSATEIENFELYNNRRMISFSSDVEKITGKTGLILQGNGRKAMELSLPELKQASELQFQDIKSIEVPSLSKVKLSLKFDDNSFKKFAAPNLTDIGQSLSFINNDKLSNISMPQLTSVGGAFKIMNNEEMDEISGFPKLETVEGGITLGGNFEEVELPKLKDVKGSSNVTSTTDIKDFCEFWEKAKDDDKISGDAKCTSNNKKALKGESGGEEADGTSSSGGDDEEEDAAGIVSVNMALLGLAAVFGVAQLL